MGPENVIHCNSELVGTVNVLGAPYKVYSVDGLLLFGQPKTGVLYGNDIYIMRDTPTEEQRSTLLHEIIHAVSAALALRLGEKTVIRLEAGLASFLQDEDSMEVMNALVLVEEDDA